MRLDEASRRPQRGQADTKKPRLCGNEVMKEEEDLVRRVVCCKRMGQKHTTPLNTTRGQSRGSWENGFL